MAMTLGDRRKRVRLALVLVLIGIAAASIGSLLDLESWWLFIILLFALLVSALALVVASGISGSPRFRRARAFNPSSRLLKKVEAKKEPPTPTPPPDWPEAELDDVPSNPPLGQPPVTVQATYDEPFDTQVQQVRLTISTDAPVLSANVLVPAQPLTGNLYIEEVDVIVADRQQGLTGKAWVYYGSDVNEPLQQSAVVSFQLS